MRLIKTSAVLVILFLPACLLLAGCEKKVGQVNAQSFAQATPEIKADWDTAWAADKANDYFTASISYTKVVMQENKLTRKQFETALAASQALAQRLTTAADSGDAAAKEALVKLMRTQNRR